MLYKFEDSIPEIGQGSYVSKSADVIGDVSIGEGCYIGPGARIKGDYGSVKIGSNTNVQENCIIHARPEEMCVVGERATIGHGAILHNCVIKDYAVIGMGAIVSDYAVVGIWGVVGEGCVVKNNQEIPDNNIAVGVPAKLIGEVDDDYKKLWTGYKNLYVKLAERYAKGLSPVGD